MKLDKVKRLGARKRIVYLLGLVSMLATCTLGGRTVLQNTPIIGADTYSEKFDFQIPVADADTTKLTEVTFCTQLFYGLALGTKIEMKWSSGTILSQEVINYNNALNLATCMTQAITGEVGTIKLMIAGSGQIQGLKLLETAADYTTTEHLIGSDSENDPISLHLNGPIIGFYGSYLLELDGLNFYVDTTYCYRSQINAFNLPDSTTLLGQDISFDMTPTSGAFHLLGGNIYNQDPCTVQYEIVTEENSLLTIYNTMALIGEKWITHGDDDGFGGTLETILGAEAKAYTGWSVTASYVDYPGITSYVQTQTFEVLIEPACQYSEIQYVDPASVIDDMTTPYYSIIWQTLPLYTHEFASTWLADDPCVISTRVESGGTFLRKDAADDGAIELFSSSILDENTANTVTIIAYYSAYSDLTPPHETFEVTITAEILPRCNIKTFASDTTLPQTTYVTNDDTIKGLTVSFAFTDSCLLVETYSATVFNQATGLEVVSPAFISFDHPSHLLNIETIAAADIGFYDIQVSSSLNILDPNALTVSTNTIDFVLVVSDSLCLNTAITASSITATEYFIDVQSGAALVQTFTSFTDTVTVSGTENCGTIQYTMTLSDPAIASAITLPAGTTDLTVQTSSMGDVGRYTASIFATLTNYQEFNNILGITVEVEILIDNGCLHTSFDLSAPMPTMIQFYGRSTTEPVIEQLLSVKDSVSLTEGNQDGVTYCGSRLYQLDLQEIGKFVDQTSMEVINVQQTNSNGPLTLYDDSLTLMLEVAGVEELGRYKYSLRVDLNDYQGPEWMKTPGNFGWYVYVIPDCAASQVIGVIDDADLVVTVGTTEVLELTETTSAISIKYEALGGVADYCGPIYNSVSLADGETLPDFIYFDENEGTISVAPTRVADVGQYRLVIKYILADYEVYGHVQEQTVRLFVELSSLNHPPYLANVIGYRSKVTLEIGDVFYFPLEIVDPDDLSLEEMTVTMTCNPDIDSFTASNFTAATSEFTFAAQLSDAGHTYLIDVSLHDQGISSNYTWQVYVKMPTLEQKLEEIKRVIEVQEKQLQLISKQTNSVQEDFFAQNDLPVVNPRDITILRDLKDYPLPYIESIDRKGNIRVTFSRPIANCETEEEIEATKALIDQGLRFKLVSGDTDEVITQSVHQATVQDKETYVPKRQLADVVEEDAPLKENDDIISWQITSLDSTGFKLSFKIKQLEQDLVSRKDNVLSLVFSGGNDYLISASDGKKIGKNKFYVTKIVVPKQMPSGKIADVIDETLDQIRRSLTIAIIVIYALGIYYDFTFQSFWVVMSCIGILSHVALNSALQHVYTEITYEMILSVIRIDINDFQATFSDWLFEKYDFTSTGAYSPAFYTLGYKSKNVISNIGPINAVFLLFFVSVFIQIMFWSKTCLFFKCSRGYAIRAKKFQPQTFLIRFFLVFFVILGVSALIPISPFTEGQQGFSFLETQKEGGSNHDQMLDIFAYLTIVLLLIFNVVVVFFSCTQANKLYNISYYKRMVERAELIIEIFTGEKPEDEQNRRMRERGGHEVSANLSSDHQSEEQVLAKMDRRGNYADDPGQLATIQFDNTFLQGSVLARTILNKEEHDKINGLDESPDKSMNGDDRISSETNLQITVGDPKVDKYQENLHKKNNSTLVKYMGKFVRVMAPHDDEIASLVSRNQKLRIDALQKADKIQLRWSDIESYQFFVEFLKGMRTDQPAIMVYYALFVTRRSLMVATLVLLHEYSAVTVTIIMHLTVATALGHVTMGHVHASRRVDMFDRTCEMVIYLASCVQMLQLCFFEIADTTAEIDLHQGLEIFGFVNLGLVGGFTTFAILLILLITLSKVVKIFYLWGKRKLAMRRLKQAMKKSLEEMKNRPKEEQVAQLAAVSALMEKVRIQKAKDDGEDIDIPSKKTTGENVKNNEDSSSSSSSGSSSSQESGNEDDLKKKKKKSAKDNGLNLISEDSDDESSSSESGENDESVPDKEVNDDSSDMSNISKNQVAPLEDDDDKVDMADSYSRTKIHQKKRDKMSESLKQIKEEFRAKSERQAQLDMNDDVDYRGADPFYDDDEGELRGPGPPLKVDHAQQQSTKPDRMPTKKSSRMTGQITEQIIEVSEQESVAEASDGHPAKHKRAQDRYAKFFEIDHDDELQQARQHQMESATAAAAVDKEVGKDGTLDEQEDKTVDFMSMNALERMTDPNRRPSINRNDEILPLPSRQQRKRQNRREAPVLQLESLFEDSDEGENVDEEEEEGNGPGQPAATDERVNASSLDEQNQRQATNEDDFELV